MKTRLRWEQVSSEEDQEITQRLKVPGGWLVLTGINFNQLAIGPYGTQWKSPQCAIAQTFVPDPDYTWRLE